ncbi:MAG: glycosyltransferase family 2 protein [Patescibacteria group bacterium]|jgi:GT2 family glycosyltransferase
MKPRLSIIILTWNTAQITKKCVLSIIKYLNNLEKEIIVVDNNSSDNTVSLISKIPNVKVIVNKDNFGFSKGNNVGAKYAKADYLLFLNSDMEIIDDSLRDLLNYTRSKPNVGVVGPMFLNPDLSPQASVFPPQTPKNAFREFFLNQPSYSKYIPKHQNPIPVWAISGGALLISKKLFIKVGGWNEKYFMYFEDLDLCRAVRCLGYEVYYFPKSQVIHRHGASGTKLADNQNQWKRLVPGSKLYHGALTHYLINIIIWLGQKWQVLKR